MSYDISLRDPVTDDVIRAESKHLIAGGTYAIGGTDELWLNVTYNYSRWYYRAGVFGPASGNKGIRTIYNMSGAESIPVLMNAIKALESTDEDISEDERAKYESQGCTGYWLPTRTNAIKPLYQLLAFARLRPDGVWQGD